MEPAGVEAAQPWPVSKLLTLRRQLTATNVELNFSKLPLHIVRGRAQHLYDEEGTEYLDCVNNVCHGAHLSDLQQLRLARCSRWVTVGHCHPSVVAATVSQIQTLNTNSRYLHQTLLEASRRANILRSSFSLLTVSLQPAHLQSAGAALSRAVGELGL